MLDWSSGLDAGVGGSFVVASAEDEEGVEEAIVPVLLVSVEEVGTVVPRAERLRSVVFRADEVVVDMIIRSMCETRLSDESWRQSCLSGPLDELVDTGGGG